MALIDSGAHRRCVRPALFRTKFADHPIASYGGSYTLITFRGVIYAITCGHVIGDFSEGDLAITSTSGGGKAVGVSTSHRISQPIDDAVDSDLEDILLMKVSNRVGLDWFEDQPLILSEAELFYVCANDRLRVVGFPSQSLKIDNYGIELARAELQMEYCGRNTYDGLLHKAYLPARGEDVKSVDGYSGGAVFHEVSQSFLGLVVRGSVNSCGEVILWFIEAHDLREIIKASFSPGALHHYNKSVVNL